MSKLTMVQHFLIGNQGRTGILILAVSLFILDFALGMMPPAKKPADSFVSDDERNTLRGIPEKLEDKTVPGFFDDGSVPNAISGF